MTALGAAGGWVFPCPGPEYDLTVPQSPDFSPVPGEPTPARRAPATEVGISRPGLIFGVLAYLVWGSLPAYFIALAPTGAFELVAMRIIFSLVFCVLIIVVTRAWRPLTALLREPRLLWILAAAAALIFINWQVYAWAALNGHVIEAALGYFINPIVTVFLGVVVLRERLRPAQWTAVAISGVAVVVLAINYGAFPWISLVLAFSFATYGLTKSKVGGRVDAVSGLTVETAFLVPVAIIQLIAVGSISGLTFGQVSVGHSLMLMGSGVITAVPLLLFAAAARRLPLVYVGLLQYLTPILQFLFGAFVMMEPMPTGRWVGFAIVWLALIVLTVDMMVSSRGLRRARIPVIPA